MILTTMPGYIKSRPRPHKLEGYTTRQHEGYVLAKFPKDYPLTSPQKRVKEVAKACGIHKGMSRKSLVDAMKGCVASKF